MERVLERESREKVLEREIMKFRKKGWGKEVLEKEGLERENEESFRERK